jgi:hypothetical protein
MKAKEHEKCARTQVDNLLPIARDAKEWGEEDNKTQKKNE